MYYNEKQLVNAKTYSNQSVEVKIIYLLSLEVFKGGYSIIYSI